MSLTAAVFHATMLPYVVAAVVASVSHAVTAVRMLLFVMHMAQVTEPTVHRKLNVGHAVWQVVPHAV